MALTSAMQPSAVGLGQQATLWMNADAESDWNMLQDSFTGKGQLVLIAHVSLDHSNVSETASTLEFAQRAGKMQVKVRLSLCRQLGKLPLPCCCPPAAWCESLLCLVQIAGFRLSAEACHSL